MLQRRIIANVVKVIDRIFEIQTSAVGPLVGASSSQPGLQPPPPWHPTSSFEMLKTKAFVLITHSMSEKYLARIGGVWHPWL